MSDRRDKCKCGKNIMWDTNDRIVECASCGTKYKVDCDSVLVYWLAEIVEEKKPYTTPAR